MGREADKEVQTRQKQNLKAFEDWLKAHGKMILPIPNRAVIYAGFPPVELTGVRTTTTNDITCDATDAR